MTRWRQEQLRLENAYARAMLHEDGIVEVTTKRQWKNGTRQFKLPTGQLLATYKSGYVRRCDSSDRIWQLNPKYQREDRWVWVYEDTGRTYVRRGMAWARALIYSEMTRLIFIVEYYLRNYKTNTKTNR